MALAQRRGPQLGRLPECDQRDAQLRAGPRFLSQQVGRQIRNLREGGDLRGTQPARRIDQDVRDAHRIRAAAVRDVMGVLVLDPERPPLRVLAGQHGRGDTMAGERGAVADLGDSHRLGQERQHWAGQGQIGEGRRS